MENSKVINLCSFNEIWDEDGDALFESNLANVFEFFQKEKLFKNFKQKYIFLVSKIFYGREVYRYSKKRKGTILKLLNYWEITFKEEFSEASLSRFHEKINFRMELYEKEAERKAAWGMYGATIRAQNERREYQQAYKSSIDQREKELKRLNNRPNSLIIGG